MTWIFNDRSRFQSCRFQFPVSTSHGVTEGNLEVRLGRRTKVRMNISRPQFRSPILCIDDFLTEEDAQRVLQECIDLKKIYMPAKIFDGPHATKIDQKYRRNEVVYLDDVFRSAPERSDILRIIKKKIWTEECKKLWHDGDYIFDIINYSTWQECVLSPIW